MPSVAITLGVICVFSLISLILGENAPTMQDVARIKALDPEMWKAIDGYGILRKYGFTGGASNGFGTTISTDGVSIDDDSLQQQSKEIKAKEKASSEKMGSTSSGSNNQNNNNNDDDKKNDDKTDEQGSDKKTGENGTQTNSTTTGQNGKTERVDVENSAPGKRDGNIQYHDAFNNKYYYDNETAIFNGTPPRINKLLTESCIKNTIVKALKYLGY